MKKSMFGSMVLMLVAPVLSVAQSQSLMTTLRADIPRYCRDAYLAPEDPDQRLYSACLQEQEQALVRLRDMQGRYAGQEFYRDIALPYCRQAQSPNESTNVVQLSFCLEDEIDGYLDIQDLRRRYGGSRIDGEAREALSVSGSWAAAAGLVKRSTNLKTVRRGSAS